MDRWLWLLLRYCKCIAISISISIYLPIYLSTYLPIYLSTYLSIYLSLSTNCYNIYVIPCTKVFSMGTAMCDCGPLLFKQHVKPERSQWWKSSTMRAWTSCQKEFEPWDVWNHQLVGGLEHFLYMVFPFHVWDVILPIDFHIVQRGWNHHPVKILEVRDVRIDGLPLVLAFLSSKGTQVAPYCSTKISIRNEV